MINKKIIIVILILFNIIFVVSSFSQMQEKVDLKLYKQFDYKEKVDVTIYLKDKNTNFDLQKKDLEIEYKSETRNVVSATITKRALNELLSNKNVLRVKSRPKLRTFLQDSVPLVNASSVWPIQILGSNITGKNEVICIIDSGINYSHVALGGCSRSTFLAGNCSKVIGGYAFYNNVTQDKNDVIGDSDHGTHVAGIAVANGSIIGVAPEAKIVALKACGPTSACDYNAIVDSISWCVNNAFIYNITVISMSLGSIPPDLYTNYCDNEDANVTSLINNATSMNISVVAATGNNGNTTAIAWPACIKNVTAVSGTDKSDSMYSDGNRNNITDLLAPGVSINSTVLNGGYGSLLGTSMATPHVAGAFVLVRQFFRLQNNRVPTPEEIKNVLNNTGKRIDDSTGSGYNFSRIDVWSALISIDSTAPIVNLTSPSNATMQFNQNLTFRCSANDVLLSNITLYVWNSSGIYNNTEIKSVSGVNANAEFNLTNITYGSYKWNCLAYDSKGNFSFASSNYSFFVRASPPVFGVLHSIHTTISDGTMSQSQRVSNLQSKYDWASTVEHDTWISTNEWTSIKNESNGNNSDNNFTYFVGYEWKGVNFNNGEILVFFKDNGPTTKINGNDTDYDTPSELISWLSSNNGIGCINHPARTSNYINWSNSEINNQSYLPCVEILNKQYYHWNDYWNCSENSGCTTYANPKPDTNGVTWGGGVKRALDNGLHLGFVAGWDYHGSYPANPSAYTGLVNAPNWTREGVFETIKNRHTWAAEDKIIMDVRISNGSNTFIMGDVFNTSYNGIYLNFSINATAGKNISNLSLFYDGIIINLTQFSNQQNVSGFFNLTFSNNNEHYIFIEAVENDGNRSWSSPVYITYKDLIPPLITINSPSSTIYSSSSIIFNVNLNENGYCEYSLNNGTTNNTMTSSNNLTWYSTSSLLNGNYIVNFYCNDTAGNKNYTSSISFSVSVPTAIASSGGGGPTYQTYILTAEQASQGYTQELKKDDKIKFTFFDETAGEHTLTIDYVGDNFVNLTIQSSIVRLVLGLGQSAKLNLTSSDYYDLYIKLNSIENNKAKLTIQTIHEEIPKPKITGQVAEEKEEKEKKETEKSEEEIKAEEEELRKEIIDKIKNLLIVILIVSVLILLAERITRERREKLKKRKK